jgi:hypothetical protein
MSTEMMLAQVQLEEKTFELAQRKAKVYSDSSLVPTQYQKNIGNVLIAQNMASRMGADVLMVMQNLYIVHGKPAWSAQFLIACFNSCQRFTSIKYRIDGKGDDYGCVAYATEIATGEEVQGVRVTIGMAKAEGWSTKAGSKWKTMPDLMLRYRAATFLVRCTAPEIGLGLMTSEELHDTVDGRVTSRQTNAVTTADDLTKLLAETPQTAIAEASESVNWQAKLDAAMSHRQLQELRKEIELNAELISDVDYQSVMAEIEDRIEILSAENAV